MYHYTPVRPSGGPFMVIGFLVMSGFLLGLFFEKSESFDVNRFYGSKLKRLMPIFLLALLPCVLSRVAMHQALMPLPPRAWGEVDLTSLVEWYNMPAWYMVVEFSMLLAAPFFCFMYKSRYGLQIGFLLAVLYAAFLFSKVPYGAPFGSGLYFSPSARCWQFLSGIVVARVWCRRKEEIGRWLTSMAGKVFTLACLLFFVMAWSALSVLKQETQLHYLNYTFGFEVITTVFFMLLIPIAYRGRIGGSMLLSTTLVRLAVLTYPIYLFHVPLLKITRDAIAPLMGIQDDGCIGVAAGLICVILAAVVQKVQEMFVR